MDDEQTLAEFLEENSLPEDDTPQVVTDLAAMIEGVGGLDRQERADRAGYAFILGYLVAMRVNPVKTLTVAAELAPLVERFV